jgi:hypothetical protein
VSIRELSTLAMGGKEGGWQDGKENGGRMVRRVGTGNNT